VEVWEQVTYIFVVIDVGVSGRQTLEVLRPFAGRTREIIHRFAVHRFANDNQCGVSKTNIFSSGSDILRAATVISKSYEM
jgi:hypothetical protein